MHELSIAQSVIEAVEQECASRGIGPVESVRLRIGRMSGVLPDSLRFCWDLVTQETSLAGAALDIVVTEPRLRCTPCDRDLSFDSFIERCPHCGSPDMRVEGGMDLAIDSLEVRQEAVP